MQSDTLTSYFFATGLDYAMDVATGGKEENVSFKIKRRTSKPDSTIQADTNDINTIPR